MQVVCEATQNQAVEVQAAAFETLVRIMSLYYDKMSYYMERALFGVCPSTPSPFAGADPYKVDCSRYEPSRRASRPPSSRVLVHRMRRGNRIGHRSRRGSSLNLCPGRVVDILYE